MPNFRELMTMPADGGDLISAIKRDETKRQYRRFEAQFLHLDNPALTAFERGDYGPAPAVLERAARLSGWTAHSGDACPVPHGTMVEIRTRGGSTGSEVAESYSWRTDGTHHDIVEWRVATQEAAEAPKVGGWVMREADTDDMPPVPNDQLVWLRYAGRLSRTSNCACQAGRVSWGERDDGLRVIAYSTDAVCPPWPEAK